MSFRKDFPIFEHQKSLVYLDTAASAQTPRCVIDRMSDFYSKEYATVHRAIYSLSLQSSDAYAQSRERVKDFLSAPSHGEIVFTKSTTEAINLLAYSFGSFLKEGDEVLISEIEHHANLLPWQRACAEKSAILKTIPVNDQGQIDLLAYKKCLSPRTKLIACAHISNSLGTRQNIEEMLCIAQKKKIPFLIDAAQSAAHCPLNLSQLDPDFLVFSGHKIYGPTGVAVLYAKREHLDKMPPYQLGGDMVDRVSLTDYHLQEPPAKFEAGTPMIAEVLGLARALEYLQDIGMQNIHDKEQALIEFTYDKLQSIPGLKLLGPPPKERGGIFSFVHEKVHPMDIASFLDLKNIALRSGQHCSQPSMDRMKISASSRASLGIYTEQREIEFFIEALKECLNRLS